MLASRIVLLLPTEIRCEMGGLILALVVQKFGGTSVADLDRGFALLPSVSPVRGGMGDQVAVNVSAMAGTTNQLVEWVEDIGGVALRSRRI